VLVAGVASFQLNYNIIAADTFFRLRLPLPQRGRFEGRGAYSFARGRFGTYKKALLSEEAGSQRLRVLVARVRL
jgi:hypothetical protein